MPTLAWVLPKRGTAASVPDQDESAAAAGPDDTLVPAVSTVHALPEQVSRPAASSEKFERSTCCECLRHGIKRAILLIIIASSSSSRIIQIELLGKTKKHSNKSTKRCTRSQISQGNWVPARYEKPPYPCALAPSDHFLCRNSTKEGWNTYDWTVNDICLFSEWSDDDFCSLLRNQTILFWGDSLTREQYIDIVRRYGWNGTKHDIFWGDDRPICDGSTWVSLRVDRTLKGRNGTPRPPDIVVANRGMHYTPDNEFSSGIDKAIKWLQNWQMNSPHCRKTSSFCLSTWRTSVPGHPSCQRFHKPSDNLLEMERLVANQSMYNTPSEYTKLGWWAMKHQNLIAKEIFASSNLSYAVIDAYDLQILRPDLHLGPGDCVHNFEMTKQPVINQIFLHILKSRSLGMLYED